MTTKILHMQDLAPALRRRAETRAMHRQNLKNAFVVTFWGGYLMACGWLWKFIYTNAHLFGV